MLILTRKPAEKIIIGDNIEIQIINVRGKLVRFGVTAPKEIAVHRDEWYAALKKKESI